MGGKKNLAKHPSKGEVFAQLCLWYHGGVELKFIADTNVGKLARWLRLLGYDVAFIPNIDDGQLVRTALEQGRVVLTRDTQFMRRRLVTSGRLHALLIEGDDPKTQVRQVIRTFNLATDDGFSRCLECNEPLIPKLKEEVQCLVPSFVYETQDNFMLCPACRRIYWKGTHWQGMVRKLEEIREGQA